MDLAKTILPIVTFFLGCLFTLYAKRLHDRRQFYQMSVREISRLTTAWYNQIQGYPHSLKEIMPLSHLSDSEQTMRQYVNNRLILPDLLFNLAVIEREARYKELTRRTQEFLDIVTIRRGSALNCRGCGKIQELSLTDLDSALQGIAIEAGRLLD